RVGFGLDTFVGKRFPETWPAGTGFELRIRAEQRIAAAHAHILPFFVVVDVLAGERRLGAFLARDLVLLRRQLLAPLCIGFLNLLVHDFLYSYQLLLFLPNKRPNTPPILRYQGLCSGLGGGCTLKSSGNWTDAM